MQGQISGLAEEVEVALQEKAGKESDIKALQTEKELQAGGEVKELQQIADKLAKK